MTAESSETPTPGEGGRSSRWLWLIVLAPLALSGCGGSGQASEATPSASAADSCDRMAEDLKAEDARVHVNSPHIIGIGSIEQDVSSGKLVCTGTAYYSDGNADRGSLLTFERKPDGYISFSFRDR